MEPPGYNSTHVPHLEMYSCVEGKFLITFSKIKSSVNVLKVGAVWLFKPLSKGHVSLNAVSLNTFFKQILQNHFIEKLS